MAEEHRRRSGVDKRKPNENQRARCTSRGSPIPQDFGAGMFASAARFVKWNELRLPVRKTQRTPLRTARGAVQGRPRPSGRRRGRKIGSRTAHRLSLRSRPPCSKKKLPLGALIVHLNDAHHWTRERIAAWVADPDVPQDE